MTKNGFIQAKIVIMPMGTEENLATRATKLMEEVNARVGTNIARVWIGPPKDTLYDAGIFGIEQVVFCGEQELKAGIYQVKDMVAGKQYPIPADHLLDYIAGCYKG